MKDGAREMIKPGDRVMLIWGCCPEFRSYIGWIATVVAVLPRRCCCKFCGQKSPAPIAEFSEARGHGYIPISWLRKLPPDDEQPADTVDHRITEPA